MIEKITASEFGPISKTIELDFTSGKTVEKKIDSDYTVQGSEVLKSIFIYGSNNSGKSQVLRLVKFLKDITLDGKKIFDSQDYYPNMYIGEGKIKTKLAKVTKLEYQILINQNRYKYSLELVLKGNKILKEELSKNEKKVFVRNEGMDLDDDIFYLVHQYSKEGGNEDIKEVYEFMQNIIYINPETTFGNMKEFSSNHLRKLNQNVFQINQTLKKFGFDFSIAVEKDNETLKETEHVYVKKSKVKSIFGMFESFGTECFIKLLIEILSINSNVIVVDEIERGLNFELLSKFLQYLNKEFPNKQFIYATHMTDILEESYRKDQFYISEIIDNSLKIERKFDKENYRNTHNLRRYFVTGRVGGIPKIVFENNLGEE